MSKRKIILALISFLAIQCTLLGQVSVTGPVCVIPGTVYLYNINANWDSSSTMQICIHGGILVDSGGNDTCSHGGSLLIATQVIWNDLSSAYISVSSSKGNASLNVTITDPLRPGSIVDSCKTQTIAFNTSPLTIYCAPDTGGSCSPAYEFQWQQSSDAIVWLDVDGAITQNLHITDLLSNTIYYRRKVKETSSGSIGYSDVATVLVNPALR